MKKITIEIDEQGNSTLDIRGCHDKQCDKIAADFQGSDKTVHKTLKPSYYHAWITNRLRGK